MKHGVLCLTILLFFASSSCTPENRMVVGKIQKSSKLTTVEFHIDKLVFGVKNKRILWFINLNQAQFLAKSHAVIKTGIDCYKLKPEDIKIEGRKISVLLPNVQVINFSYPAEDFTELDVYSHNVFSAKINLDDQEKYFREAEIDIRNSLKYMDIEKITQDKTRLMLEALLKSLGYTEIYISFKEGSLITEIMEEINK